MAFHKQPQPAASDPPWLRNAGVRADEFALQARLSALPPPPPPPEGSEGFERDVKRRRVCETAGTGLNYRAVAATSSSPVHAAQTLAFRRAMPASFVPQRHVIFVLGRPCMVPRRKKPITRYSWLTCIPRPPPGGYEGNQYSAEKNGL